jgi:hypothetical protein
MPRPRPLGQRATLSGPPLYRQQRSRLTKYLTVEICLVEAKGNREDNMHRLIVAPFIALVVAVIGSSSAGAQSPPFGAQPMDEHCRSDWSTREKWGSTLGMTWPQFLTFCRTHAGAWNNEGSLNPAPAQASSTAGTKSHHTKHPTRPTVQRAATPAAGEPAWHENPNGTSAIQHQMEEQYRQY